MKICVITYSLFSHGGVQRVTSTLFNKLSQNNQIDIVYIGNLDYCKNKLYGLDENRVNIKIRKLKISFCRKVIRKVVTELNNRSGIFDNRHTCNSLENILYSKSQKEDFINFINNENYDIVIGSEGEISLWLASIADRLNAKTIGWQHNSYDAYYYKKNRYLWKREYLSINILPRLDTVVVLTEDDKKKYREKMNIECRRIYNPLSFSSTEKSKCMSNNILSVGRLEKQKGFDLLIRAFHKVSLKNKDWTLTIVGGGSEKDSLINLINELGLSQRINIIDFTNDVKSYYLNSSIFVSSSRWEGFGLVVTEAMECGLPVIAFDNAGPKEIINHNINGLLVPCEDINALANAMIDLINDQQKRGEMSKNALIRAQHFNVDNIAEKWQQLFIHLTK